MKLKRLLSLFSVLSLFVITHAYAQQPAAGKGSVSGRLIDGANGQPLEFATVALIKKADNMPAKSIQTDLQGNFKLDNVPDGFYQFRATYVGYATYIKDSVLVGPKKRLFQLGQIKLIIAKGLLKEVKVQAQKSTIQLGIDKKTFNVDESLVSQGGSATDLLSNVPSVQVDVDGNLNLRGSSNVRVLINGKPSALAGSNMADILASIPASAIENIEVITNPSSKYDAEGQSGIINIVLKKNAKLGFTGLLSGSVGTQSTYNVNGSIAYQDKGINVYANYGHRQGERVGNGFTNKTLFDPVNGTYYQDQIADQSFNVKADNVRAGVDFTLDPKTTLSFAGNGNFRGQDRFQYGNTTTTNSKGAVTQLTTQNNMSHGYDTHNYDFTADFDHKYKKAGQELTANFGYTSGQNYANDNQVTAYNYYTRVPAVFTQHTQTNASGNQEHSINIQADYTKPLDRNNKYDMGFRGTISQNDSHNEIDSLSGTTYVPDLDLTNHFLYQEQIYAVYSDYQQQFGKFGIQGGVRVEDAHIRTLLRDNGERHGQDYFRVYPSIFLSEKLSENQTVQLSYTRRVTRPRDRQISPFLDKSDPFNYQQGNPNLLPEDTHSFELSYINYWKTLTLTSSIYYRLTNDNIQQIRSPYVHPNGVVDTAITELQYQNIKNSQNSGFELIAKVNATNTIDLTANINVYYRYLQGDPAFNLPTSSGFAWNANLTGNVKFTKKLGLQLRGDYQAPQIITQGRQRAQAGLDGGLKYDLTKSLSLSSSVRDALNTRKFGSIIDYTTGPVPYHSESVRRFQTRVILFTVAYRFGSSPDEKKKKKTDKKDNPDDLGNPDDPTGGAGGNTSGGGMPPPLKSGNQ